MKDYYEHINQLARDIDSLTTEKIIVTNKMVCEIQELLNYRYSEAVQIHKVTDSIVRFYVVGLDLVRAVRLDDSTYWDECRQSKNRLLGEIY